MIRFVTPIVHPSSIMRGRFALEPAQVAYLKRISAVPHPEIVDIAQVPPGFNIDPTPNELLTFADLARLAPEGAYLVFDIENAGPHLVCCGVYLPHLKRGVTFRFRRQGGAPWWDSWGDHLTATRAMWDVFAAPQTIKAGHFIIQHDVPFLMDLGFEVNGPLLDTSVLLHAVHSELPKGLAFNATLFCGAPAWKHLKDLKDADTGSETDEGE